MTKHDLVVFGIIGGVLFGMGASGLAARAIPPMPVGVGVVFSLAGIILLFWAAGKAL